MNTQKPEQLGQKGEKVFYLLPAFFVLAIGWSRYLPLENPALHNFSPVLALFFCCALYLRGHLSWLAPTVAVIGSDLVLNPTYGQNSLEPFMLTTYAGYATAFMLGKLVTRQRKPLTILGGILGSSICFYLLTNSFAWISNPAYPKTLAGLAQSLTVGLPGYPPTYLFFRNSILSDLIFTGTFAFVLEKALARSQEKSSAVSSMSAAKP
jgi:hypothetical protein